MNRILSWGEVRLGLRLIVKQPILSITIILALALPGVKAATRCRLPCERPRNLARPHVRW